MPLGPVKSPNRESPLGREKAALEIQKLKLDMRYSRRTFALQATNAFVLVAIAVMGFYFVQRPQIDHLEAARVQAEKQRQATEKVQVLNTVITTLGISKDEDKQRVLEMLANAWPQYEFVRAFLDAQRAIAKAPTGAVTCGRSTASVKDLEQAIESVRAAVRLEVQGMGKSKTAGMGPVARELENQLRDLEMRLEIERKRAGSLC